MTLREKNRPFRPKDDIVIEYVVGKLYKTRDRQKKMASSCSMLV